MDYENVDFNEWRQFDDRTSDDRMIGPACKAEISGRCTNCWGPIAGLKHQDGHWTLIQCQICGRSVNGDDAANEAIRMEAEANVNMPMARIGSSCKYDPTARFVLKILPDMIRDKVHFDSRIATKLTAEPKKNWLGRQDYPPGTPGYLYAQACAFLAGLNNLPRETSAISFADFDIGEPIVHDQPLNAGEAVRVTATIPVQYRKPPDSVLMARMGTTMVAGMVAAFACEVGMKAVLLTRKDEAKKTHNLLELYEALPEDSRKRLKADFEGVADILKENRHTFGRQRYFEQSIDGDAFKALVNTERVRGLAKAARVIVDECVVSGLRYDIDIEGEFNFTAEPGDAQYWEQYEVDVTGNESAIPWERIMAKGQGNRT